MIHIGPTTQLKSPHGFSLKTCNFFWNWTQNKSFSCRLVWRITQSCGDYGWNKNFPFKSTFSWYRLSREINHPIKLMRFFMLSFGFCWSICIKIHLRIAEGLSCASIVYSSRSDTGAPPNPTHWKQCQMKQNKSKQNNILDRITKWKSGLNTQT